jgi:hypothetical protein
MLNQIKKLLSNNQIQKIVKQTPSSLEITQELTEAELVAIAAGADSEPTLIDNYNQKLGLLYNHNETIVNAKEIFLSSSIPVEIEKLTMEEFVAIAAGADSDPSLIDKDNQKLGLSTNHNETIVNAKEIFLSSSIPVEIEKLTKA